MGAPIKHRKKFVSHKKRWDKRTIEEESVLVKDYALKNKKEIRKIEFQIGKYKKIAKELNRNTATKESVEAKNFIERLKQAGFLKPEASTIDEVLDITERDIMERRLSNILYKNKKARTPTQARQFVTHGHVKVGGKVITSPSYLVTLNEELAVDFKGNSSLSDENHPERSTTVQQKAMPADTLEEEFEKNEEAAEKSEVENPKVEEMEKVAEEMEDNEEAPEEQKE